jgi:hypothetical protein
VLPVLIPVNLAIFAWETFVLTGQISLTQSQAKIMGITILH